MKQGPIDRISPLI